ncbi:copia protein [Nephila pilipes]|uniref:Copia protein n=1 Tax=Nephila pilipes TaxID=299642 RepID=A0A8X6PNG4_NEPPI|nr:copia protein [Nephila pilipes]
MFTCVTSLVTTLNIEVYEATGIVCADTGARQSVGEELMFKFLKNLVQKFTELYLSICLANGQQSTSLVQKTTVPITRLHDVTAYAALLRRPFLRVAKFSPQSP